MRRLLVLGLLSIVLPVSLFPQSVVRTVLTGRVTDAATGEPLPNATVMLTDRSAGTAADDRGVYRLLLPGGTSEVRCALVGYAEREITVRGGDQDTLRRDISLTPSSVEADEVSVTGERTPLAPLPALNAVSVAPSRAASISGAFRDAYHTIQALPGVASNNETSSQFTVRGGSVDQNLVVLNNATLLEPFHLKESPNTSAGIVPLDVIGRLIFIPGGFPARYGDRLSSVLDLEVRDGNRDRLAGQAELSLTNAGAIAEGPLGAGACGILSFRTSYSGYIAHYLPDGDRRRPGYYDLLAGVSASPAANHRLSGQLLHAHDRTSGLASGEYSTTMAGVQSVLALGEADTLLAWASFYRQKDDLSRARGMFLDDERNTTTTASLTLVGEAKVRYEARPGEHFKMVGGMDVQQADYDIVRTDHSAVETGDSTAVGRLNRPVTRSALYLENHLEWGRLLVNAGLRIEQASSGGGMKAGPRFLASWRLAGGTRIKGAWGIYYQSPNQTQLLAAAQAGFAAPGMQRAIHYTVGVEQALRRDLSFRVEAYIKTLDNLISFERLRNGETVSAPRNDARGNVKGIECEAAFSDPRVFGWINVAVMRAEEFNLYDGKGWRLSPTDQRKSVTTVFEFRMSPQWSVNLRAFYGSGFAYVNDLPGVPDLRLHYPEYKRADVRLTHARTIGPLAATIYIEVLNIFSHRNAFSFTGEQKNPLTPDVNLLLPMIVNAGVRVEW